MAQPPHPRIVTRLVDGHVCAYDLAAGAADVLSPAVSFRPVPGDEVVDRAVAADLRRAYYTTLDAVVCVTSDGDEVWRSAFGPPSDRRFGHWPGCALSADGRTVWVYRPDVMAGRDRPDQWVVLDAGTGALVARADLSTVGQGGRQLSHRTSGQVLLNVGEGQDGSVVYRGSLTEGRMDLVRYPWDDRCLIDLSPDGRRFLTVHHDQTDLAVHTYPDGEVAFTLTVDAFGHDPDGTYLEWSGGYLDQDTVVVTLVGETEDEDETEGEEVGEEWRRHYRVDACSGRVRGEFDAMVAGDSDDFRPLGDGSWLTTAPSGHPVRRTEPPGAAREPLR
ncbi:hypothetical protein PUR61_09355 [Streptomyces sp. BE20]|uniref:hypothetical protein n=1 Tax=Streptomyces sp. BE20 TaxID=3002525 RepID=UPI002E798587|nr:hypothetical protein [Streptomyces sp. BE20]MEE1822398.1 hypothetical protein [Streptomyces sp. BE20]